MRRIAILLAVVVVMVVLYGQINYAVAPYKNWDLATYRNIAATAPGIPTDTCQPHGYRLLGPYLVGLLPVPDPVGFYAASTLASMCLLFALYYFFRTVGLAATVAVVTVVLYAFNRFWFGSTLWDFFQINDLLSQIWIVLLFLAMLKGRWLAFGVVLLLGAVTRETSLIMVPVAFVYLWERKELRRQGLRLAAAIVPAAGAFALIRWLLPLHCGMGLIEQFVANAPSILSPEKIVRLLIYSYLPLSLLPFVFWSTTRKFFAARLHMLVMLAIVFVMPLFAPGFDERLLAPAFIVIYSLIGYLIQELHFDDVLVGIMLAASFLSTLHHSTARFPLPNRSWTLAISLVSLAVVTAAAIVFRLKQGRGSQMEAASEL